MKSAWKIAKWLVGAMLFGAAAYGGYIAMILEGVHILLIRNNSTQEIHLTVHVIDNELRPALLRPNDLGLRWKSIKGNEGTIWISCSDGNSRYDYGLGYVTFNEFTFYLVIFDSCANLATVGEAYFLPNGVRVVDVAKRTISRRKT